MNVGLNVGQRAALAGLILTLEHQTLLQMDIPQIAAVTIWVFAWACPTSGEFRAWKDAMKDAMTGRS